MHGWMIELHQHDIQFALAQRLANVFVVAASCLGRDGAAGKAKHEAALRFTYGLLPAKPKKFRLVRTIDQCIRRQ